MEPLPPHTGQGAAQVIVDAVARGLALGDGANRGGRLADDELRQTVDWGQEGSRVRGLCYWYDQDKKFGFIRYLRSLAGPLWATDTTRDDSPYSTAFVHGSELQRAAVRPSQLPSRRVILEFTLGPSPTKPGELTAQDIAVPVSLRLGYRGGVAQIEDGCIMSRTVFWRNRSKGDC